VAHALVRGASALLPTPGFDPVSAGNGVGMSAQDAAASTLLAEDAAAALRCARLLESLDTARTSACATSSEVRAGRHGIDGILSG